MPYRAKTFCLQPGCAALAESGQSYCTPHLQQRQGEYEHIRGSSSTRGYGKRWQENRLMFLRSHPLCADIYGIHREQHQIIVATEVDHITPRSRGGTDEWNNLEGLCKSCHSLKTAKEDGRWHKKGIHSDDHGGGGMKISAAPIKRPVGQSQKHARETQAGGDNA